MSACPSCGVELPPSAKFCLVCGAKVEPGPAAAPDRRKVVTILFSDVAGSTAMGERLDAEAVRSLMSRYFAAMKAVIERHGGTVEKFIGDAIMAVFGIPQLHEDDALRAVRAAAEMRTALAALNRELGAQHGVMIETRTGVATGEVVVGDPAADQTLVTGDTVNTAARLEQAAPGGEILIGEATWRLVRDAVTVESLEPVAAKGKAEAVRAHRLISVRADAVEGHQRRMDAPLVGRTFQASRSGWWTARIAYVRWPAVSSSRDPLGSVAVVASCAVMLSGTRPPLAVSSVRRSGSLARLAYSTVPSRAMRSTGFGFSSGNELMEAAAASSVGSRAVLALRSVSFPEDDDYYRTPLSRGSAVEWNVRSWVPWGPSHGGMR